MVIRENKSQLRNRFRQERQERFIEDSWRHILTVTEIILATNIATYISYDFEPETKDLNQALIDSGKMVFLPRLLPNNDLEWVKWDGTQESVSLNGKVFEPIGPAISNIELEVIIVPALHVDRDGNRLGQGGGSYDRALARSNAWKIALLHRGEITNEPLPIEPYDQKLNAAATPEIMVRF
jgi:5-formyltetrahydrofolate cyclo-ligase